MSTNVTNNRKVVFEWKKKLGDYAYRWRIDFYSFSFRIHYWKCSDDMRAYHSHPVNMLIFILWVQYIDHYINHNNEECKRTYKPLHFRIIKRDYRHCVEIIKPSITLLFTWGIPKRWAFWLKGTLKRKNRDRYFIEHGHHVCDH